MCKYFLHKPWTFVAPLSYSFVDPSVRRGLSELVTGILSYRQGSDLRVPVASLEIEDLKERELLSEGVLVSYDHAGMP
jgi:hypothetical protein